MLPAPARLRRQADFAHTLRRGRRCGRRTLVVSLLPEPAGDEATAPLPRVGFVVGRRVGGAVVRNRVRRRLRHLVAARLHTLPPGSRVVIRALPGAEGVPYATLADDLDAALARVLR